MPAVVIASVAEALLRQSIAEKQAVPGLDNATTDRGRCEKAKMDAEG